MPEGFMPTICAGTDTQPACRHYKAAGCWHPQNLTLDVVIGKLRPRNSAEWMRDRAAPDPGFFARQIRPRCGPAAQFFEPIKAPDALAFLEGSTLAPHAEHVAEGKPPL